MPKHSPTGNAHKRCACGRSRQASCAHPWFVAYKAPRSHVLRAGQRFRLNLDTLIGFHPSNLSEAKTEARRAIEAWLNGRDPAALQPSDLPTLAQTLDAYHQRPEAPAREVGQFGPITRASITGRRFGDWRMVEITREVIEAYRRQRPRVAANRDLALLRAMFNWAVLAELVPSTPFRVGTVAAIKLAREEPRTRRLEPGEADRLLAGAHGLLAHLIVAALETGCRLGELLSLQWEQVRGDLFLPAGKTKAKKPRRVPISSVLRGVLDGRRLDPAGDVLPASAYVFGDAIGRRRRSRLVFAWENAVLASRNLTPVREKNGHLTAACRAAFHAIDLHFHDLRREAGSRWMDAGVPLATIQRWLGHHNISQTSVYLGASLGGDEQDMQRFEQRIGRMPAVAQGGISDDPNGSHATRSDITSAEILRKDADGHEPTPTIH